MSKDIVVKKGLDLMLIGAPSLEIEEAKLSKDYSIYPSDFHGVYPKLIVKENDLIKAGEALFFDKNSERVKFVSPVSGKIKEIVNIDFPRPRMNNSEVKISKTYAELRDHIWNLVKDEAMQTTRGE